MWLKNEGFFLAELLLSLSAWLMAACVLLPLSISLITQSIDLRREADALYLLYDRLQEMKIRTEPIGTESINRNGTLFTIRASDHSPESLVEVCVDFDGYFTKKMSKCAWAE